LFVEQEVAMSEYEQPTPGDPEDPVNPSPAAGEEGLTTAEVAEQRAGEGEEPHIPPEVKPVDEEA
jgi:hypothetical protein